MIRFAQEKNKKPIKVHHVTPHKYKYPIIDIQNEKLQSQGFGGNAFGPGFYATDDKKVLKGYMENQDGAYVRNHIIPRGSVIVNYNIFPKRLLELYNDELDLSNYSDYIDLNILYAHINLEDFYSFLLSQGIDVIKYSPGSVYGGESYKGYNYLIINENIINNPRGKKEYSETKKNYDHIQNRKIRPYGYVPKKEINPIEDNKDKTLEELMNLVISGDLTQEEMTKIIVNQAYRKEPIK